MDFILFYKKIKVWLAGTFPLLEFLFGSMEILSNQFGESYWTGET